MRLLFLYPKLSRTRRSSSHNTHPRTYSSSPIPEPVSDNESLDYSEWDLPEELEPEVLRTQQEKKEHQAFVRALDNIEFTLKHSVKDAILEACYHLSEGRKQHAQDWTYQAIIKLAACRTALRELNRKLVGRSRINRKTAVHELTELYRDYHLAVYGYTQALNIRFNPVTSYTISLLFAELKL